MVGKRAAHYTNRIANDICEGIVMGKSLQEALNDIGFLAPNIVTVYKWLDLYPEFREKYERARQLQADLQADSMLEMSRSVIKEPKAATAYRVAVDILKWQAAVRNPGKYGKTIDESGKNKPLDPAKLQLKGKSAEELAGIFQMAVWLFEDTPELTHESIERAFRVLSEKLDVKLRDLSRPFYVAITGSEASTPLFRSMEILGLDLTQVSNQQRLQLAVRGHDLLRKPTLRRT